MKKTFITFKLAALMLTASLVTHAQSPQKFNYQGVARNGSGAPISSQMIGLRITILDGSASGNAEYVETHNITTSAYGLYNLAIGSGTIISGTMNDIDWSTGSKFIKVEVDPTGGTNYADLGTAQLLSVPYALYAQNGAGGAPGPQGPPGADGTPGTDGAPGTVGPTGPAGPMGLSGATGAAGPQGLAGPTGPQGLIGPAGAVGPQGSPGVAGATGAAGAQGLAGVPGADGAQGVAGPVGPQGPVGPSGGPQGPAGPQGPTGSQGPAGDAGLIGATGPQGATGAAGPIGPQGTTGPAGPIGATGAQGVAGVAGPIGPAGPVGPAGMTGAPGAAGPVGPQGPAGTDAQILTLTGNVLSISNGNNVTLPSGGGSVNGTINYVPKFTSATAVGNSSLYDVGGRVGIGTTLPTAKLSLVGTDTIPLIATYKSTTSIPNGVVRAMDSTYYGTAIWGQSILPDENIVSGTGILGLGGNIGLRAAGQSASTDGQVFGLYSTSYSLDTAIGVYGFAGTYDGTTIAGGKYGVLGYAEGGSNNYGIYGSAGIALNNSYAGYFDGNVHVAGSLSKAMGTFKIDHPQDPENKYLYHSFVESPDMMNVYNGNTTTDANGYASVTLPGYFESLNKDFRYQLTVVGSTFAQAIVSQKVSGNLFQIRTSEPNIEVSWQVTGIRDDAYARAHRVEPEVEKEANNKGLYLNPVELKKDPSLQIDKAPSPKNEGTNLSKRPAISKR